MSWRAEDFRDHYVQHIGTSDQAFQYAALLRQLDRQWLGLDEKIGELGFIQISMWARKLRAGLFANTPMATQFRIALNCYLKFLIDDANPDAARPIAAPPTPKDREDDGLIRQEHRLQAAVRRDLDVLEPGLVAIDGGQERVVPTGRIDILACDAQGVQLVIELKAGPCPADALEQALGYTTDIARLSGMPCRTIIVAGSFGARTRAAARRVPHLKLVEYRLRLQFGEVN
jgi:hypothetical protein